MSKANASGRCWIGSKLLNITTPLRIHRELANGFISPLGETFFLDAMLPALKAQKPIFDTPTQKVDTSAQARNHRF